jgi:lambda family phage portal protein
VDSFYTHGEVLGLLPLIDRPNALTQTKVKLLPAHKLVQDTIDSIGLVQGITHGAWGFPLKYRVCMPVDYGVEQAVDIMAYDQTRKQVLHIFKGVAGQMRGITPFVHVLKTLRQFDQLSDATLTKALMDAIFAATVESQSPTTEILQALQDEGEQGIGGASVTDYLAAKTAWYENTKIDLGRGGRIAHLYPGEKLAFNTTSKISNDYEAFVKILLRELARCMGLSFETVTGDYSGATYSSVRMSSSSLWPLTLSRRKNIVARLMQDVFEAWLTEEIMSSRVPFKDGAFAYMAQRKFVCRADWRGPPKPQADDLKAAKAMEVLKRLGIASDEQLCSELGTDYEDVYEQRAREKDLREELDLPEGDTLTPDPTGDELLNDNPNPAKESA